MEASDRGKLSWETCSKQRTPRRAVEIPDVLLPVIFYFFYIPPIKVDPAQKSRESCAFYQSSAVKREFSSVGTPRVNQKAGNVLSSLVFQFHFFRQQKTSLTSLTWFVGLDTANLCWKSWIRKEKGEFNFLFSRLKGLCSLRPLPCLNKERWLPTKWLENF